MKKPRLAKTTLPLLLGIFCLLPGCRPAHTTWQGYLEGEFVYVSSPLAGRLDTLAVAKGQRVSKGAALFTLERDAELASQRQAVAELDVSQARLVDLSKGARTPEIAALAARLQQATAAEELSRLDRDRQKKLLDGKAISQSEYDHARLTDVANSRAVQQLNADLATAKQPGRPDIVTAAQATVRADQAAKERADWAVDQKEQKAPTDSLVYDTLYRQGEFVAAGLPVVTLLPPENIKVRFFVPELAYSQLKIGSQVQVSLSGRDAPIQATVSYLSPQAEYTPPVLYNRDNRAKLVYMVEAVLDPAVARDLHPGQPADISPSP